MNSKLRIPVYQRAYSWTEDNVNALFEDIRNAGSNDYFIGTIVVKSASDRVEVIDGQQRLATAIIFYAALRDYLRSIGMDDWTQIQSDFIARKSLRSSELEPKLALNNNDNEYFMKTIVELHTEESSKPIFASNERIKEAYTTCAKMIRKLGGEDGHQIDDVWDVYDFVTKKLKIIVVSVSSEDNAFSIFEALNDRGLDLTKSDLIKNLLFHKAGTREAEATSKWQKFTGTIENNLNEKDVLDFIRNQWSSVNGLTREKELYEVIKKTINSSAKAIKYLDDLESDANIYLALSNDRSPIWEEIAASRSYIQQLILLKVSQNRPLLIAITKKIDKKDVAKCISMVLSWSVRNLITGSIPAGTLEREFSAIAKDISSGSITTAVALRKKIKDFFPEDANFLQAFQIHTVSKAPLARYYLSKIEESHRPTRELQVPDDPTIVNLEHILPEKPDFKTDWRNWTHEDHNAYVKRLGNMTLMEVQMNSDIKSSSFSEKKPYYGQSQINITSSLTQYPDWTKDEVEARQEAFAKKAVKIWTLKF